MPPADRLRRRVERFGNELCRVWPQNGGFATFRTSLDKVDYASAVEELNADVEAHLAPICAREDSFITETLPTMALFQCAHIDAVWTGAGGQQRASATNKDIIWQHLDLVFSAACPELKTMLDGRKAHQMEVQKRTANTTGLLNDVLSGRIKPERIASAASQFLGEGIFTPDMLQRFSKGEAATAIQKLATSPQMVDTIAVAMQNLQAAGAAGPDGIKDMLSDGSMLNTLRRAMQHRPVRMHMRTVIAHFAPVLAKIIDNAQKAGADTSAPAMRLMHKILTRAGGHPWAKVVDRIGTSEGAEALLNLAATSNPNGLTRSDIAKALAIDEDQIPELIESAKYAASVAKEFGDTASASEGRGLAGVISSILGTITQAGGEAPPEEPR